MSLDSRGSWSWIYSRWQDLRREFKRMENPRLPMSGYVYMPVSALLGRNSLTPAQILRTTERATLLPFHRYGNKSKPAEMLLPTFEWNAICCRAYHLLPTLISCLDSFCIITYVLGSWFPCLWTNEIVFGQSFSALEKRSIGREVQASRN